MVDIDMQRRSALEAAREQREKRVRLAASLDPNAPAKTPVPEHPEPSPRDRFGGVKENH